MKEKPSTGSVWHDRSIAHQRTLHKYGAGSGSDRMMVELLIELQMRAFVYPKVHPVATAPGSVFVRRSSSGNAYLMPNCTSTNTPNPT
jgi:hypothetical protein